MATNPTYSVLALIPADTSTHDLSIRVVAIGSGLCACVEDAETDRIQRFADLAKADPQWLAGELARHHRLVLALHQSGSVFPMQFGVLTSDLAALGDAVHEHHEALDAYFGLIEGCDEWAVKLLAEVEPSVVPSTRPSDGTSYLLSLRAAKLAKAELTRQRGERATGALEHLQGLARHIRNLPAGESERLLGGAAMISNHALLVPRSVLGEFEAAISLARQELSDTSLRMEITGPWPPYSFRPRLDQPSVLEEA